MSLLTTILLTKDRRPRSGWRFLAFLLISGTLAMSLDWLWMALHGWLGRSPSPLGAPWILALGAFLASYLIVRLEGRTLGELGLSWDRRWGFDLVLGFLGGLGIMVASALLLGSLDGFHWVRPSSPSAASMLRAGALYAAVALGEELTFRGYGLQRVAEGLGKPTAQGLFALLFALAHVQNPGIQAADPILRSVALINIGLAGLILGLAWQRTGSLASSIGLHWSWNWTQESLLGFRVSGSSGPVTSFLQPFLHDRPTWLTGGSVGLEGSVACTAVALLTLVVLLRWKGRHTDRTP